MLGGFVGLAHSLTYSCSVTLNILNSANKGSVSAEGVACGFVCVDPEYNFNVKATVKNSINKGSVNAGTNAYGIANIITGARNVVSMGDVTGLSGSYPFWNAYSYTDLYYGLDDKCNNWCNSATRFKYNKCPWFYEVVGTGEHVDDLLNAESEKQSYGMMWTSQLELVDEWVNPSSEISMSCSDMSSSDMSSSVTSQSKSSSESETPTSSSSVVSSNSMSQSTPLSVATIDAISPFIIAVVLVFTCAIGF